MDSFKPISIGPVRIDAPVILAPMTGVTDLPFRKVVKRFGAGLTVSEMIASQAMIRETRQSLQKAAWDPSEEPVSLQLAGCGPVEMAEAARLNEQRGAAIIEARGASSAASAASATVDHARTWTLGTPEGDWVSMAVVSQGEYGVPEGLISSFPVTTSGGDWSIVEGLEIDEFSRARIDASTAELADERSAVTELGLI